MARNAARPGRTLAVFFLVIAVIYGCVALGKTWKPELGLDLQGGTRIMMIANGHPSGDAMKETRDIINARVNGNGVTAAKVTTQGSNVILVEIPGQNRDDLVDEVSATAQLRFRLVACEQTCGTPSATTPGISTPSTQVTIPPTAGASKSRAMLSYDLKKATSTPSASPSTTATDTTSPSADASATQTPDQKGDVTVQDAVAFMNAPTSDWTTKFASFTCPAQGAAAVDDDPSQPLMTCDANGVPYLLSPAIIEGTEISDANYGIPSNSLTYAVTLDFKSKGRAAFADATGAIAGTGQLFAIVLDGQVLEAATADSRINGGAQITGTFDQNSASALANNLKYGALPVTFDKTNGISHTTIGPSLAGNQLSAGLWAGGIGLIIVMIYALLYYRGLGIVVVGSLVVAAIAIYGMVLLLSKGADFTLDLPGIAGLIVAVGITADSFIVYFERIRDEMRDGKSMRVAVESGWKRARNTTLAADTVSLLAAVVLYIFAAGDVRGFAFALGLSTVIDLAVFFFFTHPLIEVLSTFRFFNRGHRLSGLGAEALGIDAIRVDATRTGGAA